MLNKKLLIAVLLAACLIGGVTAAVVIRFVLHISNQATILGYEVALWNTQTSQKITSFDWGTLALGQVKTTDELLGDPGQSQRPLKIENLDAYYVEIGWNYTGTLPNGVSLSAEFYNAGMMRYDPWDMNNFAEMGQLVPNGISTSVCWVLTVADNAQGCGAFNFTINVLAGTG
jgi:hypothetical protein